ncbi:hypothetical protein CR513_61296, partial [Mucuna pruriens]
MENNKKMTHYFTRVIILTNFMKGYGEKIPNVKIVEKVLQTLPSKFYHIVEPKNLRILKVEELQGSLLTNQALIAQAPRKGGAKIGKDKKGKGKWRNSKSNFSGGSFRDQDLGVILIKLIKKKWINSK